MMVRTMERADREVQSEAGDGEGVEAAQMRHARQAGFVRCTGRGASPMACVIGRQGLIQVRGAAPVVSYEVPVNAATSGGATVTISGLSFGVYGFTPTGHAVKEVDCGTTSWSSATTAQCLLSTPTSLSTSYSKVTVGAVVGTKASSVFTFDGMW